MHFWRHAAFGVTLAAAMSVPVFGQTTGFTLVAPNANANPPAAMPQSGCFPGDPVVTLNTKTKLYTLDGSIPQSTANPWPQPMWNPTGFNDASPNGGIPNSALPNSTLPNSAIPNSTIPTGAGIGQSSSATNVKKVCKSDADGMGAHLAAGGVDAASFAVPTFSTRYLNGRTRPGAGNPGLPGILRP